MSFEVDLGWPDIVRRDRDYYSADEADSGDINDMLDSIPFNSYSREASDFTSEIDLDDLLYELPGEDGEIEYEVVMLIGVQPDDVPAGAEKQTAHLRIRIMSNETASADNADDAASEVEFITRDLKRLEDDSVILVGISSGGDGQGVMFTRVSAHLNSIETSSPMFLPHGPYLKLISGKEIFLQNLFCFQ